MKTRKTFVQLFNEASSPSNWRVAPSSRFRWYCAEVYRNGQQAAWRYYKTKKLAETFAKSSFPMYVVGKVQGFV